MLGTEPGAGASAPTSRQGYEPNCAGRNFASALHFFDCFTNGPAWSRICCFDQGWRHVSKITS
eukprot:7437235-Prorocentrum_lima.AAC.1